MLLKRLIDCIKAKSSWEDICSKCGECCFEREIDDDGCVFTDYESPCEFLDTETRLCRVYDERFEVCERCNKVTPRIALFTDYLPESCEYRRRFGG